MRTAASRSENLPLCKISSKSSPPLQILYNNQSLSCKNYDLKVNLLGHEVVALIILEELVHLDDIWVVLKIKFLVNSEREKYGEYLSSYN